MNLFRTRSTIVAALLIVGAVAACSSGSTATAPDACAVTSVVISPSSVSVQIGKSTPLTALVTGVNCATITTTWQSTSTATATVSASGVVGGVAAGSTTITATAGGKTGTSTVTVTPAPAPGASSMAAGVRGAGSV